MSTVRDAGTPSQTTISFEDRLWVAEHADEVTVEDYKGKRSLHVTGQEAAFVYLPDVEFKNGTIEVDIASSTFSGIGFRGRNNGTWAEKIYFRPFNSGTPTHKNTVQYFMIGNPEGHWRFLRENFPGKYETGAELTPNEWFHVRLEVQGQRCQVFVDEKDEPVLVVEELLDGRSIGKIGVWGWNSYFANLQFSPAE